MQNARWYPTVTTLPDGKMLISSGRGFPLTGPPAQAMWYNTIARDYEVFQPGGAPDSLGGLIGHFIPNGLAGGGDFATYPSVMVLPRSPANPDGVVFMQEQRAGRLYAYRSRAPQILEQAQDSAGRTVTWTMHDVGSRSYPYYGSAVLLPFEAADPRHIRIWVTGGQGEEYRVYPLKL